MASLTRWRLSDRSQAIAAHSFQHSLTVIAFFLIRGDCVDFVIARVRGGSEGGEGTSDC